MFRGKGGRLGKLMRLATVACLPFALLTACENDDDPVVEPELPPTGVTVSISVDIDVITVTWTSATTATSYRIELAGGTTMTKTAMATETSAVFDEGDGVVDGTAYTATVYAINDSGETASSNAPSITTDYFPWDEYYETSLHRTGMGKQTFYNEVPNGGFEKYTGVPYSGLVCQGCHTPGLGYGTVQGERGCASCHEDDNPQLGAQVDANLTDGVCGPCHGRQKAEALVHQFSDVHRDADMDCMACHTLEDMHGDGNPYVSMLDDGAIDSKCSDCHSDVASNMYHNTHAENISCSACHIQSVVTCNNCHFESEVEVHQKIAYGQFKNWKFLLNRDGKVDIGNYQSVTHNGKAVVAFGPYYAHTIAKDAVSCGDCHGNAATTQWHDEGVIDVVVWDETKGDPNGKNLVQTQGIIPIPPNYFEGGLRFDMVTLNEPGGTIWSYIGNSTEMLANDEFIFQILYGTPLTQDQMDKLK
jgi:hypothetical protein